MLPKCRFFRGRGHRFLWNRKTRSPDWQSGAVSGVSRIRYFRMGGSGFPDYSQDRRKVPLIRALYGAGLHLWTLFFRDFVQKQVHFYTLFQESRDTPDLRQTGHFTRTYKTLLYAFGGQISGPDGLQHVEMKRRAVLGIVFRIPQSYDSIRLLCGFTGSYEKRKRGDR